VAQVLQVLKDYREPQELKEVAQVLQEGLDLQEPLVRQEHLVILLLDQLVLKEL
jgi:hypothetical protein